MERRYLCSLARGLTVVLMMVTLPACVIVRMTEHRVEFRTDGGGRAWLRLTDIRSDGTTDSTVERDFRIMMDSFEEEGIEDFEKGGRRIASKRFIVHGDTLSAEIEYTFDSMEDIEGLNVTNEELFIVVPEDRVVVWTNGRISPWDRGTLRILWNRNAESLSYQIRERDLPSSVSLARLYLAGREKSSRESN